MKYMIAFFEGAVYWFNPQDLISALKKRWFDVEVQKNPPELLLGEELEWKIPSQNHFTGYLYHERKTVFVEGTTEECIEFALWYRKFIPSEHRILFSDEGYHASIEMRPETTSVDILRAFANREHADLNSG